MLQEITCPIPAPTQLDYLQTTDHRQTVAITAKVAKDMHFIIVKINTLHMKWQVNCQR